MKSLNRITLHCFLLSFWVASCNSATQSPEKKPIALVDRINAVYTLEGISDSDNGLELKRGIDSLYNLILEYGDQHGSDLSKAVLYCKQNYTKLFESNAELLKVTFENGSGAGEAGRAYCNYLLRQQYVEVKLLQMELKHHFDELDSLSIK